MTRTGLTKRTLWALAGGAFLAIPLALVWMGSHPRATGAAGGGDDDEERYLALFNDVLNVIRNEYVDPEKVVARKLIVGAITTMVDAIGDPHTSYLTARQSTDLRTEIKGEFGGLGIEIGTRDRWLTVVSPMQDTPAWRAGLKAGDRIVKIEGESTKGISVDDAVGKLRGEIGTDVTITIVREGEPRPFDVTIKRGKITIPAIRYEMLPGDKKIGYVSIAKFSEKTESQLNGALADLIRNGMQAVVVDLRGNPGGSLDAALQASDCFLSRGVIVSTRARDARYNRAYTASSATACPERFPMVVLVDEGSASASEIFAGSMQDTRRATIVGTRSFGKASVQNLEPVGRDGADALRITTARYYTPAGRMIQREEGATNWGITPDVVIEERRYNRRENEMMDKLLKSGMVREFLEAYPEYDDEDLSAFLQEVWANDIILDQETVRRLVRNETYKKTKPPIVDLESDVQLQGAIEVLKLHDLSSAHRP